MCSVSVVVPLFNKRAEVSRAIASILRQSDPPEEVLVVDDGSTDGSGDIARAAAPDKRVRVIRQDNAGASAARNTGILNARFDLVAFLDADDEWLPSFLQAVNVLVRKWPAAGAYATAYLVSQSGGMAYRARIAGLPKQWRAGVVPDYFATRNLITSSTVVVPKRTFRAIGLFSPDLHMGEDVEMWYRIASRYPIVYRNAPHAIWHCEAENRACRLHGNVVNRPLERAARTAARDPTIPREMRVAAAAYAARFDLDVAMRVILAGNRRSGEAALAEWRRRHAATPRWACCRIMAMLPSGVTRSLRRVWTLLGRAISRPVRATGATTEDAAWL